VDNLAPKPLVEQMCASGLKPRTINKYVEYIKQVVKSRRTYFASAFFREITKTMERCMVPDTRRIRDGGNYVEGVFQS
jgi:hypothetical protein